MSHAGSRAFWLLWLAGAAFLLAICWGDIAALRFPDPDDLLRLQEVRDLLGGQSWFDVTQYRLNPPAGGGMHWSRLVDVPLAGAILLLRPMLGMAEAERAASVIVPLLTYGVALAILLRLTDRLAGRTAAIVAGAMLAIDPGVLSAIRPMRIDHHGWQAVCGLAMAWLVVARRSAAAAAWAGVAAALWASISLEALPFVAATAGLLALHWAIDPAPGRWRAAAFLAALAGASLLIGLATHGSALAQSWCDAISPVHLLLFGGAAAGVALLACLSPPTPMLRLGGLAVLGVVLLLLYRQGTPQCAGGPFGSLDPLVYRFWYLKVLEGRPIWEQPLTGALFGVGFPTIGLLAAAWAWRTSTGEARRRWGDMALLTAAALAVAVLLVRAGAFANLLALPAVATLLVAALGAIRRWRSPPRRVLASAGVVLALLPVTPTMIAGIATALAKPAPARSIAWRCNRLQTMAALDALPPATILSPLDIAPTIIVGSHHATVASGHHRNAAAMRDVIAFFVGPEVQAHAIARRHGARYLALCRGEPELALYRKASRTGFIHRLDRGPAPAWLQPIRMAKFTHGRLWRIVG